MDFKIINIEKHHKNKLYKLIEAINIEDNLSYSLTSEWLDYVIENAGKGIWNNQPRKKGDIMPNQTMMEQNTKIIEQSVNPHIGGCINISL